MICLSRGTPIESEVQGPCKSIRRVLPAVALFVIAPLIAEFLLGNMSITHLGLLVILAPLYGGGALLIRESVRRAGRPWPSIFLLALAFGILEEAFLTESLFNPDYLGLNLHLLNTAHISLFGIGAWYTVFVLTLHTVWSIPVPIALTEALVPERANSRWIGKPAIGAVAALFVLACLSIGSFSIPMDSMHIVASRAQLACSALIIFVLIISAFSLHRWPAAKRSWRVPDPRIVGLISFSIASAFLVIPREWAWWAVVAYLSLYVFAVVPTLIWSNRTGWRSIHRLSLAGGAAMAYAWHAFLQTPSLGDAGAITRMGNLLFAVLAAILVGAGARKLGDSRHAAR